VTVASQVLRPRALPSDPDHSLRQLAHFAGYCAYAFMVATVVWGLLTTSGTVRSSVRRETIYGGHMLLSVAALSFGALHASAHLFRSVHPYTLVQEFVPFSTPLKVTFGVVGLQLMAVAAGSVWFQRRLGYGRWHQLHRQVAGPAFALIIGHVVLTAHGLMSPAVMIPIGMSLVGVLFILGLRLRPMAKVSVLS
jgi:DMSO/TMAO reductase YedYZ heme-binding membrane subunit